MVQTYGTLGLTAATLTIIAIVAAVLTVLSALAGNLLDRSLVGHILFVVAFTLAAILAATLWTTAGAWMEGGPFTFFGGVAILGVPFLAFVEFD